VATRFGLASEKSKIVRFCTCQSLDSKAHYSSGAVGDLATHSGWCAPPNKFLLAVYRRTSVRLAVKDVLFVSHKRSCACLTGRSKGMCYFNGLLFIFGLIAWLFGGGALPAA
jgi:hypothetical protein